MRTVCALRAWHSPYCTANIFDFGQGKFRHLPERQKIQQKFLHPKIYPILYAGLAPNNNDALSPQHASQRTGSGNKRLVIHSLEISSSYFLVVDQEFKESRVSLECILQRWNCTLCTLHTAHSLHYPLAQCKLHAVYSLVHTLHCPICTLPLHLLCTCALVLTVPCAHHTARCAMRTHTECCAHHQGNNLRGFFRGGQNGGGDLELLLRNEGNFWFKAPCCCFLGDGCCYLLVVSGWLLLFPDGLWMVTGWALDGC